MAPTSGRSPSGSPLRGDCARCSSEVRGRSGGLRTGAIGQDPGSQFALLGADHVDLPLDLRLGTVAAAHLARRWSARTATWCRFDG